jgi:hypothetical protein
MKQLQIETRKMNKGQDPSQQPLHLKAEEAQ